MTAPERLERDALAGDVDAATRWLAELARRGQPQRAEAAPAELIDAALGRDDHRGLAALMLALGQIERVTTALSLAWQQKQWQRLESLGHALGLALTPAQREAIDDLVGRVNRDERILSRADLVRGHLRLQVGTPRDDRLLGPDEVLAALLQARLDPSGLGTAAGTRRVAGVQGLMLAVRLDDGELVLGATRSTRRSPGSAWPVLQPWRKNLAHNREAALAWAAQRMPDRVRLPVRALPDDAQAWRERAILEAADPILGTLLAEPSRSGFNKLVAALNKARGKDRDRLAAVLERRLAAWPDEVRVGTRSWLKSLAVDHRKGAWRPGWRLIRRLELDDETRADDPGLEALLHSPFVESLGHLVVHRVEAGVLERLVTGDWPALRTLELTTDDLVATVDALVANPALTARIGALDVGLQGRGVPLPDVLQPRPGDEIKLALRWSSDAQAADGAQALGRLFDGAAPVESVRVGWLQGALGWLEPIAAGGGLRRTRYLAVDADYDDTDALTRLLDGDARPRNLDTLVLGWSGDPLYPLVELARGRALDGLRCLALIGMFTHHGLADLARTAMAYSLETLILWPFAAFQVDVRVLVEVLCLPALADLRTLGLPADDVLYVVRNARDAGALGALEQLLVSGGDAPTLAQLSALLGAGVDVVAVTAPR